MEIKMSLDEVHSLNGKGCKFILNSMSDEFARRNYLKERYDRADSLKTLRAETDPTQKEVIVTYEKHITDVSVGYIVGKEPTYYNSKKNTVDSKKTMFGVDKSRIVALEQPENTYEESEEFYKNILSIHKNNNNQKENIELTRRCFVTSKAYEMIYTNENAEIKYKILNDDCVAIKSNDIEEKIIAFLRQYSTTKYVMENDSMTTKEISVIELYTNQKRVYYTSEDDYAKETSLFTEGTYPMKETWEIPIVEITMPDGIGIFEQQVSEIEAYELVTNNSKKTLNYNDDAILVVKGVMFQNGESEEEIEKMVTQYKTQGVIFIGDDDDGGDARWLTKDINDGTTQNHKDNLKNDIFSVAGLFDPSNDNQVYQNTLSLLFKLYALEQKMSEYQVEFISAMKRRIKIIAEILNEMNQTNYDYKDIEIIMFRNLPTNTNEELNFINQTKDLFPLKFIYEQISIVPDASEMYEEYKEWKLEEARLNAEVSKILSSGTEDDMQTTHTKDSIENAQSEQLEIDKIEETEE